MSPFTYISGPSCSKLTMSLVNVSLKLWSLNTLIFCWKNVSSFCIWKATHIFSAKIPVNELDIVLTRTVNILTTNKLVKLMTLCTTGPWHFTRHLQNENTWMKNLLYFLGKISLEIFIWKKFSLYIFDWFSSITISETTAFNVWVMKQHLQ